MEERAECSVEVADALGCWRRVKTEAPESATLDDATAAPRPGSSSGLREELLEVLQLKGHTGPIDGLRFSPDGETLASGSYDATVRLWMAPKRLE